MTGKSVGVWALASCLVTLGSVSGCYPTLGSYGQQEAIAPSCNNPLVNIPGVETIRSGAIYQTGYNNPLVNVPAVETIRSGSIYSTGCNNPLLDVPSVETIRSGPIYSTDCNVAPSYVNEASVQPAYSVPQTIVSPSVYPQNSASLLSGSIDCGPSPRPEPIRYLKSVILPEKNEPLRELPSPPLPRPVVISNKCSCTKVVQKPQIYQRIIQVQKNQRFLKKTYVPRVEKVEYCAKPRC